MRELLKVFLLVRSLVIAAPADEPPAVVIGGVIRVLGSPASAWTVRLLSPEEGKALREARIAPDAGRERSSTFRLASVPPGPYVLEVLSEEESWSCRTDLGFQDAGVRNVHALYRSPSWLSGRVVDGAGEPIGSVPVTLAPVDGEKEAGSSGPWHCGPADLREDRSDAAGRFRVPFDPGSSHAIVAGGLTDRRGIAAAFLTEPTSRELVLQPRPPTTLVLQLEDEEGLPARCSARLALTDSLSLAVSRSLEGTVSSTRCGPDGTVEVGPFLPGSYAINLLPEGGLRETLTESKPPAHGRVDLGVVKVRQGARIEVRVRDAANVPVEGATVDLLAGGVRPSVVDGRTDASGVAILSGVPERALMGLEVRSQGFAAERRKGLTVGDFPLEVVLHRATAIRGTVTSSRGAPLVGAAVRAESSLGADAEETFTDDRGAFGVDPAPSGNVRLTARLAGFRLPRPTQLSLARGESREGVRLVLERAAEIEGTVLDPAGEPAAGAHVALGYLSSADGALTVKFEAIAGEDGRFVLQGPPDAGDRIVAARPGTARAISRPLVEGVGTGGITLQLGRPARLVVTLPPGSRSDRWVRVIDGLGLGRAAATAGRRRVEFEDLAPGRATVALVPGPVRQVWLEEGRIAEANLAAGATLTGLVTAGGQPVRSAIVHADRTEPRLRLGPTAPTSPDGRYRLEGIDAGPVLLVAEAAEGRAELRLDVAEEGTVHADLTLRRVAVWVRVVEAESETPIPGADVELLPDLSQGPASGGAVRVDVLPSTDGAGYELSSTAWGGAMGTTTPHGTLLLHVSEPGAYRVNARAAGYVPFGSRLRVDEGDHELSIRLTRTPAARIHGFWAAGVRAPFVLLSCLSATGGGATAVISAPEYECHGLRPGVADVIVVAPGYGSARHRIEVPDEGEVVVPIVIPQGGTVIIPVLGLEGSPPELKDAEGFAWRSFLAGLPFVSGAPAVGLQALPTYGTAWVISDLPPGPYEVVVEGRVRGSVWLESGGTAVAW